MTFACLKSIGTLFVAVFFTTAAFVHDGHAQSGPNEPYKLEPGDLLLVSVLEDPELDREVLVLPDGRISLPIAGTIVAGGLTPQQLERLVRSRLLRNFVKPPTVTVSVTSLGEEDEEDEEPRIVYVLGEVDSPGRYEYPEDDRITVIKALSLAGGVGPFAARSRIQIREVVDNTEILRVFDYEALEDGQINTLRDLETLQDGAVIVVPERGLFE